MNRILAALVFSAAAMMPAGSALADDVHLATNVSGQPDSGGSVVNCGSPLNGTGQTLASTPGNGSATFSTSLGSPYGTTALAGSMYAGSQPQNSNNPSSISQYDVSCFQATMHMSR
jgi:hypothetical protein